MKGVCNRTNEEAQRLHENFFNGLSVTCQDIQEETQHKQKRTGKRDCFEGSSSSRKSRRTGTNSSPNAAFLSSLQDLITSHMPPSIPPSEDGSQSDASSTNPSEVLLGIRKTSNRPASAKKKKSQRK